MIDHEQVWTGTLMVLLAIAGRVAMLLHTKGVKRMSWVNLFAEVFIAGFCGLMAYLFALAIELEGSWVGIICGIAGWTSPAIIYAITKIADKVAGYELNNKHDRKGR